MTEEIMANHHSTEENKIQNHKSFPKKGGPYTDEEREKRHAEVFRLHFELGYSSREIARMMKINRHTIDEDVKHLYSQLSAEFKSYTMDAWLMTQKYRLELQRVRLLEYLDKQENFNDKLRIERMIYEIDCKIMGLAIKIDYTRQKEFEFDVNAAVKGVIPKTSGTEKFVV